MPLDHYVSQVHLKQFCNRDTRHLAVVRKRDLKSFPARTQDVCRIEDGSTNSYLVHNRAIEDFLKTVEPHYDEALDTIRAGKPDHDSVYVIAGFTAYVMSCSPTGMRLYASPLRNIVESEAISLDRLGELPPLPAVLGGSVKEAIETGKVRVEVDEKYSQALGIAQILERTALFGNARWEILRVRNDDSLFLSSDYPIAMEFTSKPHVVNRLIPLAPDLAIRMVPDTGPRTSEATLDFADFRYCVRSPSAGESRNINRTIVRCAEDLVFSSRAADWLVRFVSKNRRFQLDILNDSIQMESGTLFRGRQLVVDRDAAAK
jgi:hypothetical protein